MSYSKFEKIDYNKLLESSDESDGDVGQQPASSSSSEPAARTDEQGFRTDQRRRKKKKQAAVPANAAQMHSSCTEAVSSMIAQEVAGQFVDNENSHVAQFKAVTGRWPEMKKDKDMLITLFLDALKQGAMHMFDLLWRCLDDAHSSVARQITWHFHKIKCNGEEKYLVDFAVDFSQIPLLPQIIAGGRAKLSEKALLSLSSAPIVLRDWLQQLQQQEDEDICEFDGCVCCNARDGCHSICGCREDLRTRSMNSTSAPHQLTRACECDQQYSKALRVLFIEAIKRARPAMPNAATHLETLRLLICHVSVHCSVRPLPHIAKPP